jgi:hypothetical protein
MGCSWMAPLTPAVIVMRGLVSHPIFWILLIDGSYLVCLCVREAYRTKSTERQCQIG